MQPSYLPCARSSARAFVGETLTTANGGHQTNLFWWGNAALDYAGLRGPGRSNFDLSLFRDFRIRERYPASFSANVTNALSHTQFRPGTNTMGLGSIQVTDIPAQGVIAGETQWQAYVDTLSRQ